MSYVVVVIATVVVCWGFATLILAGSAETRRRAAIRKSNRRNHGQDH